MFEGLLLIIAVIGFIVNAAKRMRQLPPPSSPPPLFDPRLRPPTPPQQPLAGPNYETPRQPAELAGALPKPYSAAAATASSNQRRPLRANSSYSLDNQSSTNQPASQSIVSQAPMSGVAQQFAMERAQSDQRLANAARQARLTAASDVSGAACSFDARSVFDYSSALPAAPDRSSLTIKDSAIFINGLILSQVLSQPHCKSKRRAIH